MILSLLLGFFCILLVYCLLADKYSIIDKPNERSSHIKPTIRGGGIIFPIAWLVFSIYNEGIFPWFTLGLLIISVVSFIDDIKALPVRVRFFAHIVAFSLLFYELNLFELLPVWGSVLTLILCIGMVNAINFMDGINGMTGLYALSFFGVLLFYWHKGPDSGLVELSGHNPFVYIVISILVFGFFNFRKKALCFAGDVGSMSIGFTVLFFLMARFLGIWESGGTLPERADPVSGSAGIFDWSVFLFLALYGIDTILTIAYRLWRRENIFQAHRKHLYQYLANERRWPHLWVAGLYAGVQLAINLWVLGGPVPLWAGLALLLGLCAVYMGTLPMRHSLYLQEAKR